MSRRPGLSFRPLNLRNWPDLEKLSGAGGACGGCWCERLSDRVVPGIQFIAALARVVL